MPTPWQKRWRAQHGDFAVPCIVSGRWLEFSQNGSARLNEGEAISVNVMTQGTDDKPHKLCQMIVTREELIRVLGLIEKPAAGQ